MSIWILDDGPFGILARFVWPEKLKKWPSKRYFIAEQTALDADEERRALLKAEPSPFQTFTIMMDTEAAEVVHRHLRPTGGRATANLAEHQSIAWALCERTDAILVLIDRKATSLALAELGCGRVAHAHDLWLHLRNEDLVDQRQFEELCQATCRKDQSGLPLRCQ